MWDIYDSLIELVPEDWVVEECVVGLHWIMVRSGGAGLAMMPREGETRLSRAGHIAGMPLKELAQGIKSWNNLEAALGLAAINSVVNTPTAVESTLRSNYPSREGVNIFGLMPEEVRGRKVTVIGHFPNLEAMAAVCDLTILERRPAPGDLPDPACEYVLPEQDYVIVTATTLINKTLPRLLELSRGAQVVLVGPSTPMTPLLFDRGVGVLAGLVVDDQPAIAQLLKEGGHHTLFDHGTRMVVVNREPALAEASR